MGVVDNSLVAGSSSSRAGRAWYERVAAAAVAAASNRDCVAGGAVPPLPTERSRRAFPEQRATNHSVASFSIPSPRARRAYVRRRRRELRRQQRRDPQPVGKNEEAGLFFFFLSNRIVQAGRRAPRPRARHTPLPLLVFVRCSLAHSPTR